MKDWTYLLLALSPVAALPVGLLLIALGDAENLLTVAASSFLIVYGAGGFILPGNRNLLRDMHRHGIHNDR